ncbi:MAG TPA: hypothetical protein VGE64_09260 [Xanthomonadaceae bacterium]
MQPHPRPWRPVPAAHRHIRAIADHRQNGNALTAFESGYLSVPGLVIANDTLSLHPGQHRIGYVCPQPPDAVILNDAVPSLEFDFRKGRRYALRCVAGNPVIEEMPSN